MIVNKTENKTPNKTANKQNIKLEIINLKIIIILKLYNN
jgi:hypothetical protein